MRMTTKFAAVAMLSTTAFAFGGNHYWDAGHRTYYPWREESKCKLQLIEVYQPEGGSQPIHLKVKNLSNNRVRYDLSIAVDGKPSGNFHVDNANPGEISDRDADRRYRGRWRTAASWCGRATARFLCSPVS